MNVRPLPADDTANQTPPFVDVNLFTSDRVLQEAVAREGAGGRIEELARFGAVAGSRRALDLARQANENPPKLHRLDARGARLDEVEFHPAYHELMAISARQGLHCGAWDGIGTATPPTDRNVARAGAFYMAAQMEAGHCCPITMTNASVAALLHQEDVARDWLPGILARDYDPRLVQKEEKRGLTLGMGMTEKQGGTDVRTNTTRAEPAGGGEYSITGQKWFMSAPMSDAFLILAQAPAGLSCFLLPRVLPDGSRNSLRFQRLKDKLGNRSNASSEVEFECACGRLIGEEGRGIATIIDMVTYTRLDCAVSSAGLMRWCLANALHQAAHRTVFQKKLVDQPLMRQVLADLALDHEAATALVFRLARAFDRQGEDEDEAAFARVMTPAIKYWVCKALPNYSYEAMECLGGNGYVEEGPLARVFRESPINAIWEGSGNVMGLDMLRVASREQNSVERVLANFEADAGQERRLHRALGEIRDRLTRPAALESGLRSLIEALVHVAAGTLLLRHAPSAVSDAYLASRLEGPFRQTYGSLEGADASAIIERAASQARGT